MTTDDPTTPAPAAAPDRAKPPDPPAPARDPRETGAASLDAAYADAVRLGAAPSRVREVPADTAHPAAPYPGTAQSATAHTNGTYGTQAHGTNGTQAHGANGTQANGAYGTSTNGAYPEAGRPATVPFTPDAPPTPPATVPPRPETAPFEAPRPATAPPAEPAPVSRAAMPAAAPAPPVTGTDAVTEPAPARTPGTPADGTTAERAAADPADRAAGGTASAEGTTTGATSAADAVRAGAGPVDAALVDAVLAEAKSAGENGDDGDEPIRTLLWTAATYRPLEEVAALVALLKSTGAVSSPADEALRAAAVVRPLEEVRQLVAMLNEAGHPLDEADTALRAAAVGRPIEDVAELVSILGTGDAGSRPRPVPGSAPAPGTKAVDGTITVPENPNVRPPRSASVAQSAQSAPSLEKPVSVADLAGGTSPALRSGLRWPAAAALFACGVIHLPTDFAGLRSGGSTDAVALAVTLLCLILGLWLGARDTVRVWAAAGATAVGVVALHAVSGGSAFDLLATSVGQSFGWASAVAVVCAALTAALAGSALLRRQRQPDATNGA
ncbi:hypothetical protein ACGF5F_13785 [Streptomyces sp. NPDC047821]|uniref:hypothetical protein n=1 Tax=unclassified Streptomyces TaxID=2593676 RepID=UPI0036253A09